MNKILLNYNETQVIEYLKKNHGWVRPSVIAKYADSREHCCSWASHICLGLVDKGIIEHNIHGHYCYNGDI
jgi:hypothetical protein